MRWSSGWALDQVESGQNQGSGRAVLSAGVDRVVEIDGLFDDDLDLLRRWADGDPIVSAARDDFLVDQLLGLGVLIADVAPSGPGPTVRVAVIATENSGDLAAAIAHRLNDAANTDAAVTDPDSVDHQLADGPALAVALRTGERITLERTAHRPTLHVDLRHQHTLVVGPAELPGLSACDACYDVRLGRRWRIPTLPERPAVLDHERLVAELAAFHAERFLATGTHLVNATIAHSLRDGTASIDALLPVPSCSGCGRGHSATGRVRLPWETRPRPQTGDAAR